MRQLDLPTRIFFGLFVCATQSEGNVKGWRRCEASGQRVVPIRGGRQAAGEHRSPSESSALGGRVGGGVRGVRRAAGRQPFITASYVMCQHLSAFSQRLNSAVRQPPPHPAAPSAHLSLLSAHARTRRLPVFRQAGERQRCAAEWSVQSDPGLLRNRWLSDHGHCGDVRWEGGGGGRQGGGDRSPAKVGHLNHSCCFPTNQVWAKMMFRCEWTRLDFPWEGKVKMNLAFHFSLYWLGVRIHSYGNFVMYPL